MRPESPEKTDFSKPIAEPTSLPAAIQPLDSINDASLIDDASPLPDWRELGRRVLSESMRRTACELRRRNGCTGYIERTLRRPGGNS